VGVVRTAAAEDRVEEAAVGVALLQVVEVAAAIARVKAGSPSGVGWVAQVSLLRPGLSLQTSALLESHSPRT
jgi:hypothetical protein